MMPLDTIKTRLQFQGTSTSVRRYRNIIDVTRSIATEEGLLAFWRGVGVKLLYKAPAGAVSFGCYELFRRVVLNPKSLTAGDYSKVSVENPVFPLLFGATARVLGTASRTPFDIVKQRLQVAGQTRKGTTSSAAVVDESASGTARSLLKKHGLRGMWNGLGVSLLRDMPFGTIYFASYELLKQGLSFLTSHLLFNIPQTAIHFTAGGGAGFLATTLTIPFDVIKTRMQTQSALPLSERKYNGIIPSARLILREEGWVGMTRGLGARLLYLTPATAITFGAYEKFKEIFHIE